MLDLLVSADDRSGALETGGACAQAGLSVRVGICVDPDVECSVVDIASRHCPVAEAKKRVAEVHRHAEANFRCHKMDSVLRGNWADEVAALVADGRTVGVVASFPDAGRRCLNGVVYVHDEPVASSDAGRDPRNALPSSRPLDYLIDAGIGQAVDDGRVLVLDVPSIDNHRRAEP